MKKITLSMVAIILASLCLLSGCEMSFNIEEETTTNNVTTTVKAEPDTAVVEVTDDRGNVIATETVTASADVEKSAEEIFKPSNKDEDGNKVVPSGVSNDRVQQAIEAQKNPDKNTNGTTKPSNSTTKPNTGTTEEEFYDKPVVDTTQDDEAVLSSGQYYISCRIVSPDLSTECKLARKDNKSATYLTYEGEDIGFIIDSKNIYYININTQTCFVFLKEEAKGSISDEDWGVISQDPLDFERTPTAIYDETVDGVEYTVKEYGSGNKDYFIGKTIIKTTSDDGSAIYYDSISPVSPSSLFTPPANFTIEQMEIPETTEAAE